MYQAASQFPMMERMDAGRGEPVVPYIPHVFTVFQVKASNFSPTDCYNEIFVKGTQSRGHKKATQKSQAKPIWKEIATKKGCYIFFCRQGLPQSGGNKTRGITARLSKAHKALKKCKIKISTSQVKFFDGNMIAEWVNKFIATIIYVYTCLNKLPGRRGRTWREWTREESVKCDYCTNPQLDTHLSTLRQVLSQPGQIARVSGLSGLGKTRLAFEIFRPPQLLTSTYQGDDLTLLSLSESMVYLDAEHSPDEVIGAVENYEATGLRGVVVVDNCSRHHHNSLVGVIRRSNCKLSLLTLDYEPESTFSGSGETSILLDPTMMEASVVQILKTHPKVKVLNLTEHAIQHIADFAKGFPFLAVMIAESDEALNMEKLNQFGLVQKLISGHGARDPNALKILTALSLFRNVGYTDEVKEQAEFVRKTFCSSIEERDFRQLITRFKKRRIIQSAGYFIFVAPPPLAVALAADWWESACLADWDKILPLIEQNNMLEAFADRVKQLHFSENAAALAKQLCGTKGPFSEAKVLNSKSGSQLFRAIVEVNPIAAAHCIHRVFSVASHASLSKVLEGRRNLVWALEKLCWGKETFALAAEVMLNFAAAEVEDYSNNATGQFCQLFHLYLAGTQIPARERLHIIKTGLASGIPEKRKICIQALTTALQSHHFMRTGGVEVRGSGLPEKDWEPANWNEIFDYWLEVAEILSEIALSKSLDATVAKTALGRQLRQILWNPTVERLEPLIFKIAWKYRNYWPEAVASIRLSLEHDKNHHSEVSLKRVEAWLAKLSPSAPEDRLRQIVTEAPHEHRETAPNVWTDVSAEKAEALAEEFAKNLPSLPKMLPSLLKGDQSQAVSFGMKLGSLKYRPHFFIEECLAVLNKLAPEEQNPGLLGGYLHNLNDRTKITNVLNVLERNSNQQHLVPILTRFIKPQAIDLDRVVRLISSKRLSPNVLRNLIYGSILNDIPANDLIAVLDPLTQKLSNARPVVIELLHFYVHGNKEKSQACSGYIRRLIATPGIIAICRNSSISFAVQDFAIRLLSDRQDAELATLLANEIITSNSKYLAFGTDPSVLQILHVVMEKYPKMVWELLGKELIADKDIRFWVKPLYTASVEAPGKEASGSLLDAIPPEIILDWAKRHTSCVYKLLNLCTLFVAMDGSGEYEWSETVLQLIKIHFDDKCSRAIGTNLMSFFSEGSRVPYIERRIRLLAKCANHPNLKVREMVRKETENMESEKEREAAHDAHFAAGIRHA